MSYWLLRTSQKSIESKKLLLDIYIRLELYEASTSESTRITQMLHISNDLYGNDVDSSYELATGNNRPIDGSGPRAPPEYISHAHKMQIFRRKLNLNLTSKSVNDIPIEILVTLWRCSCIHAFAKLKKRIMFIS